MRPQIKIILKTDPPKSGNSDSKYNFEIFKKSKSFIKQTPPKKVEIIIQNTSSKFSKTKN